MTGDYKEKYYRLNLDWPDKAGKLSQVMATQKRLVTSMARSKQTEEAKKLIESVAEGYDVAIDLMKWMQDTLQDVGRDAHALAEGSQVHNQLKWNQEVLSEMMDAKNNRIDTILSEIRINLDRHKKKNPIIPIQEEGGQKLISQ